MTEPPQPSLLNCVQNIASNAESLSDVIISQPIKPCDT